MKPDVVGHEGQTISSKLTELVIGWMELLADPAIFAPLLLGLGIGYIYSLSPHITQFQRKSDREYRVYRCNVVVTSFLFIVTNIRNDMQNMLSMLAIVAGASVAVPFAYYNFWKKEKDNSEQVTSCPHFNSDTCQCRIEGQEKHPQMPELSRKNIRHRED